MTDGAHFLAVKPLSVKTTRASCADAVILNVMRHNARELQAEIGVGADSGIDATRIHLNVTLHGPATADGVASAARDAMREHGIVAPRKNATLGIEIVASLPAGLVIDHLAYFRDTMAWAQQHYRVPLLSAIVHNDESCPHLHLVLLPVRDGKLVGSELLGNRATMKAMQKDFHEQVAKQYGLRMPAAKKRHSAAQRAAGIALLRDTLQANSGLTESAINALLVPHAKNPEPLLVALGLAMPAPVVKGSFVATMTRKVRPERADSTYKKSPIGHFHAQTAVGFPAENGNPYALLGDCISPPNFSPPANPSGATDSAPGQQPSDQQPECATGIEQRSTNTGNPASPVAAAGGQNGTDPMATGQVSAATTVHRQASAKAQPDIACPAPATQQHERSTRTTRFFPISEITPQVATTNPGTGPTMPGTEHDGQQDAHHQTEQLRHQDATADPQAGQHQNQQHRVHAIKEQAAPGGRPQTGNAGVEVSVDTPAARSTSRGIVPTDDTRAVQPAVDVAPATDQHRPSIEHVTPCNAKAGAVTPARRANASTATPTSAPAAPRAGKRKSATSMQAATPSTASASTRSTSSTTKPKRTAQQQASGTPVTAGTLPSARRKTAKSLATCSKPEPGEQRHDDTADQPDEIRRLADDALAAARCARSTSSAPPTGVKPGNSRNNIDAAQPYEIRTLGQAAAASSSSSTATVPPTKDALKTEPTLPTAGSAGHSPEFSGQHHSPEYFVQQQVNQDASQRASERGHHGAPALDWLPMPAPRISDSATARQPATAHEDESGRHDVDSYQRLRDDENAAELWDSDLGEFVTAQARPARRTSTMHTIDAQCADDQGAVWFDARPAVIEAALDSIRAVHGQH
jgi:hypothetical protein